MFKRTMLLSVAAIVATAGCSDEQGDAAAESDLAPFEKSSEKESGDEKASAALQDAGAGASTTTKEGGADAPSTPPPSGGQGPVKQVTFKLTPTRKEWMVNGTMAYFYVDSPAVLIFGERTTLITLNIDAPATSLNPTASCTVTRPGSGARDCMEGVGVVGRTAGLKVGDHVKIRLHGEKTETFGSKSIPSKCDIAQMWKFTGTDFTLDGEPMPASGAWSCLGTNGWKTQLAYKLEAVSVID